MGRVDPRFAAGLPFLVPEILEFVAFRDPGIFFQQFSRRVLRFTEGFWGRVLGKGSQKGSEKGACYGFYSKKGF